MATADKSVVETAFDSAATAVKTGVEIVNPVVDALRSLNTAGSVKSIGRTKDVEYTEDDSKEQWCNIGIYEYTYRAESSKSLKFGLGNIKLPLPLQLQTQYQQQWNNTNDVTGLLGQALNLAGNGIQGEDLRNLATNAALNPQLVGGAIAAAGLPVAGLVAGGGIAVGSALAGVAANKFETVTYEKPQLRQHQFNWNLTAKSKEEGEAIQDIILKLKYHSHPGGDDGAYFKYPELFVVKFFSDKNLFTIGPSILENFSVDYHAAGRPLYQSSDRMPINVSISCSFRETAAITKNIIKNERR